eukprot:CAMPEP_0184365734 /NCGR_PEP_ID=MMETSP1089-20130417/150349_1 /TAXON_ID=38269 ORGANISM="Gloeochaete wittrockiana, Strain SAG46.84" /NCGR_SAMPLE_ID=MMETSP1089 /ASSEMBLY_ACC=CAM_ASM_000445 /LENGTH=1238 /DNA_ID=CAMNT_0026707081 /DNA_START=169 /DNA_END=3882 /DNA_ORIENTATION=-
MARTGSTPLVESKAIKNLSLHRPLSKPLRLDVLPFVLLYIADLCLALIFPAYHTPILIGLPIIGLLHLLAFLVTHWSIEFRCFVTARKVKDVDLATFVKIVPTPHHGKKTICPLERSSLKDDQKDAGIYFSFQKRRYDFDPVTKRFEKLKFPVSESLGTYQKQRGYGSQSDLDHAYGKYGTNRFAIPLPTFGELFKEHALAPFFVFQVFCVSLWLLDEYWYYSLFTLVMLVFFESTVVKSRLRNLQDLRGMVAPSSLVSVYRLGKWIKIPSTDLLPGDVVSIARSASGTVCPADLLLVSGTVVADESLLTGESVPQWKESISRRSSNDVFSLKNDKVHIVFGGTRILQHVPDKDSDLPKPPDQGCLGYVLRTGFNTAQGKLMRTILFSTEPVTANSLESLVFILFLLIFALVAAGYVLMKGLEDVTRSRYKLLLNCTLIITSVVPPELPMELSLAVNNSLIALARLMIFCTEPFRIPWAGKVDVCCFDKTGTLTSDELVVKGIAGLHLAQLVQPSTKEKTPNGSSQVSDPYFLTDTTNVPDEVAFVLAGCHSLVYLDNSLVGDSMEKASLSAINWSYTKGELAVSRKKSNQTVRILHRFHFSSALKRMAALATVDDGVDHDALWAMVKGAPETIEALLAKVPANYEAVHKNFSRQGFRVLALAAKRMSQMPVNEARALSRDTVESGLSFCGFVVFHCPLKQEATSVVDMLLESSHRVVMITGDHTLTACQVSLELKIVTRPVLILTAAHGPNDSIEWVSIDEKTRIPLSTSAKKLFQTYDLCVSGEAVAQMAKLPIDKVPSPQAYIPYVSVFARVSPDQKELVVTTLKSLGAVTLMCGDGTNDVGALKHAHIGVGLLKQTTLSPSSSTQLMPAASGPPSKTSSNSSSSSSIKQRKGVKGQDTPTDTTSNSKALSVPTAATSASSSSGKPPAQPQSLMEKLAAYNAQVQQARALAEANAKKGLPPPPMPKLQGLEMDEEGVPLVRFGDASIASPFTSKQGTVASTCHIIRQGRCTLVTTHQMFKILALNCLISAYSLSVLYLDGVKLGDMQATSSGILIAMFFLFISWSKPLKTLSKERPSSNLFSPSLVISIIGQFAIHLGCLIYAVHMAKEMNPEEASARPEPDGNFSPNLVNSVVYLVSCSMQIATVAVNYKGHPFMESISENKPLRNSLLFSAVVTLICATDMFRPFNQALELVPFPTMAFRNRMVLILIADVGGVYLLELFIKAVGSLRRQRTW